MYESITAWHILQVWNLLRYVFCCDWLIQNLNQSGVGHTNEPDTFARSLSHHLGKRGSPDLNTVCNLNLKRPNSTSACAIIDFGRFWARYLRFQGENRISPIFHVQGGRRSWLWISQSSSLFPEARHRKETESGLGKDTICTVCRSSRFVR